MHIPPALLSGLADDSEELLDGFLCPAAGLDQLEGDIVRHLQFYGDEAVD